MTVVKTLETSGINVKATICPTFWRRTLFVAPVAFDPRFFRATKEKGEKSYIEKEASHILLTVDILAQHVVQFYRSNSLLVCVYRYTPRIYRYIRVYVYVTGWMGRAERSGQGLLALASTGMVVD